MREVPVCAVFTRSRRRKARPRRLMLPVHSHTVHSALQDFESQRARASALQAFIAAAGFDMDTNTRPPAAGGSKRCATVQAFGSAFTSELTEFVDNPVAVT